MILSLWRRHLVEKPSGATRSFFSKDCRCYLHTGLIKIYRTSPDGKEQILRLIESGRTFNEVPTLDGGLNPASAAALEPSDVVLIEGAVMREFIHERPDVAMATIGTLTQSLCLLVSRAVRISI